MCMRKGAYNLQDQQYVHMLLQQPKSKQQQQHYKLVHLPHDCTAIHSNETQDIVWVAGTRSPAAGHIASLNRWCGPHLAATVHHLNLVHSKVNNCQRQATSSMYMAAVSQQQTICLLAIHRALQPYI